jgi:uncharacterized membrane-anchored protein
MRNQLVISLVGAVLAIGGHAQDAALLNSKLHPQEGKISLLGGAATLRLPPDFRYLDKYGAQVVLTEAWKNPPEVAASSANNGLIVPATFNISSPDAWAVAIGYTEEGYIKDEDADQINYDSLLKEMQEGIREGSEDRKKRGYPRYELIGWAAPPHYHRASHRLYWAKELHFEDESENTLNYDIRILGRRGFLALNAIASKHQLSSVESAMARLLNSVDFQEGHRYADYLPSADKVATYGIGALVAGKIAAKIGLLKWLLGILLVGKKFILVAFAGLVGFLRKFFRRKSEAAKQQEAVEGYVKDIQQQASSENQPHGESL